MWKTAKPAALAIGLGLTGAAAAHAQTWYGPGAYWPTYPAYGYPYATYGSPYGYDYSYGYPAYRYRYAYPAYGYYYGWPYGSYYRYPAPKAYSDPYVQYRPYSDNAGPKASTTGGY